MNQQHPSIRDHRYLLKFHLETLHIVVSCSLEANEREISLSVIESKTIIALQSLQGTRKFRVKITSNRKLTYLGQRSLAIRDRSKDRVSLLIFVQIIVLLIRHPFDSQKSDEEKYIMFLLRSSLDLLVTGHSWPSFWTSDLNFKFLKNSVN